MPRCAKERILPHLDSSHWSGNDGTYGDGDNGDDDDAGDYCGSDDDDGADDDDGDAPDKKNILYKCGGKATGMCFTI